MKQNISRSATGANPPGQGLHSLQERDLWMPVACASKPDSQLNFAMTSDLATVSHKDIIFTPLYTVKISGESWNPRKS